MKRNHTVQRPRRLLFIALITGVLLAGCAEKGPILLDIRYLTPEGNSAAKAVVGVSRFQDKREQPASILGKRTVPSGMQNDLVVQGTVAEIVTKGLKDALKAHGISAKDIAGWDLTAEDIKADGVSLLLGGEIKTVWLESTATNLKTSLKAEVQLRLVAADPAAKKIVKVIDVSSKLEQDVFYSREKLADALSEALTSAIDQLFKDEDLKNRLQ